MKPIVHYAASSGAPAVILLGGEANALSVARDLGRAGVRVYGIGDRGSFVRRSRYCRWIDVPVRGTIEQSWNAYLLGRDAESLHGTMLLACSDDGLQALLRNRDELSALYLLDECNPIAQGRMLDKLDTYRAAREAGVPTPGFWELSSASGVAAIRDQLTYPLLVKPRLSHLFDRRFKRKHLVVSSKEALDRALADIMPAGIEVLLMEWIPGGDDRLCSYYTYLDSQSKPLLHFTKRIIRRYPSGMGAACYHVTDWIPELIEPANRLFSHVGLRGLANVEFKHDPRDGQYKLIECNARFTASNCLVSASGVRLAELVYARATGRATPPAPGDGEYRRGLRLWDPIRDWCAFRELRRAGQITARQWLRGILHAQRLQYFSWSDPLPALARAMRPLRRRFANQQRSASENIAGVIQADCGSEGVTP